MWISNAFALGIGIIFLHSLVKPPRLAGFTALFSSFSACFWEGNTKVKLDHPLGSVELKAEAIQRQPSRITSLLSRNNFCFAKEADGN